MRLWTSGIGLLAMWSCTKATPNPTAPDARSDASAASDGNLGDGNLTDGNLADGDVPDAFESLEPIVLGTLNHMVLGGTVTSSGTGIAGVQIQFQYLTSTQPGTYFSYLTVTTDADGRYHAAFDAIPDAINGGVAFAYASKDGYEYDNRYIKVLTTHATHDFSIRLVDVITAGSSIGVTLRPDDPICVNNVQDFHPWPFNEEWVCHTVRVIAPAAGTLTIQMVPVGTPAASTQLEAETLGGDQLRYFDPTTSLPVVAGQQVLVSPELIWGASATPAFTILTSM